MTPRNEPPAPYGWQLTLLVTWGETSKADALLAALNRVNTAFGGEPYTMPEPFFGPMEGLITCPALVEVEQLPARDGRARIAA